MQAPFNIDQVPDHLFESPCIGGMTDRRDLHGNAVFALIAHDALADYIVVDRDTLGFQCGSRQKHVLSACDFLETVTQEGDSVL